MKIRQHRTVLLDTKGDLHNHQNQRHLQAANHESLKDEMISGKSHKPLSPLKVLHY